MAFSPADHHVTLALYRSHSCPFLFHDSRCAGGDYCPFPPGLEQMCCFYCPLFESCPDRTGVCSHLVK